MIKLLFAVNSLLFFNQSSVVMDGYLDKQSYLPGDSASLYLSGHATKNYELSLFDLSGKVVATQKVNLTQQAIRNANPVEDGFGYRVTKRIKVPNLPSGIYLWENVIPMIIRPKEPKIVVVYPSNTANAYSNSGGKSLYGYNSSNQVAAKKVSFLRPVPLQWHCEAFLRWLHREKIQDIGYITDMDLENYNTVKKSTMMIIPGHSEYWTLQARTNYDRFVLAGKHALILSGNSMWWQVRYNKSHDQMTCYRVKQDDPIKSEKLKTTYWNDSTLNYPITRSIGVEFTYAGYGLKNDKGWNGYKIIKTSPLLANTTLKPGDILPCPSDETDGVPLLGFSEDIPVHNNTDHFFKMEIVGFDHVMWGVKEGVATWVVFRVDASSGIVINTASTDWCSERGIGKNEDIRTITRNMISMLVNGQDVFTREGNVVN
jgi:hypothetical protein